MAPPDGVKTRRQRNNSNKPRERERERIAFLPIRDKYEAVKMLGGGGSQGGNGAFSCSSSPALPPARRHHQLHQPTSTAACWNVLGTSNGTNPFHSLSSGSVVVPSVAASEEGAALVGVSHLYGPSVQRKRPGCLCDHYNDNEEDEEDGSLSTTTDVGRYQVNDLRSAGDCMIQPLDLSLPKVKVRQHWSGGSIVQVNDSTIISINGGGAGGGSSSSSSSSTECCRCPSSSASRPSPSRLNVSVVTVPPQTSCWPGNSHFAASSLPADRQQHYPGQQHHHHPQQRQQPFRLQIEIPLEADKLSGFFRQPSSHRRKTSHSSSASGGCATSTPLPPAQVPTANNNISNQQRPPEVAGPVPATVMKDDEDDLQRLSDSAHQLRLSGYYYGHLSWKESMQLLQDTKVEKKERQMDGWIDLFFSLFSFFSLLN